MKAGCAPATGSAPGSRARRHQPARRRRCADLSVAGGPALQSERAVDCHTDAQCMNALRAVDHKCPKGETGRAAGGGDLLGGAPHRQQSLSLHASTTLRSVHMKGTLVSDVSDTNWDFRHGAAQHKAKMALATGHGYGGGRQRVHAVPSMVRESQRDVLCRGRAAAQPWHMDDARFALRPPGLTRPRTPQEGG